MKPHVKLWNHVPCTTTISRPKDGGESWESVPGNLMATQSEDYIHERQTGDGYLSRQAEVFLLVGIRFECS